MQSPVHDYETTKVPETAACITPSDCWTSLPQSEPASAKCEGMFDSVILARTAGTPKVRGEGYGALAGKERTLLLVVGSDDRRACGRNLMERRAQPSGQAASDVHEKRRA